MNAAVVLLMLHSLPAGMDDPEESVPAGAEALDPWRTDYPWYDAETDGVRRVELSEPEEDAQPTAPPGPILPGSAMQWMAWIAIILVLAAVLALLIWVLLGREWGKSSADETTAEDDAEADRVEALPFPVKPGRLDLLDQAREFYRQGDYGRAIVYLFSYQLVQLDKRQIIRLSKGKTNRRYLREIGPRQTLMRLVEPASKIALRIGEGCASYSVTSSSSIKLSGRTAAHSIAPSFWPISVRR